MRKDILIAFANILLLYGLFLGLGVFGDDLADLMGIDSLADVVYASSENDSADSADSADSTDSTNSTDDTDNTDSTDSTDGVDNDTSSDQSDVQPPDATKAGVMALTFDDGPNQETTTYLLDGLQERGVKVTFFMLGVRVKNNPSVVERAYADGHTICSHGYDHQKQFTKLNSTSLSGQIDTTAQLIFNIIESYPVYVRPPYGSINAETAAQIKYPIMLWNVDPRDWDVREAEHIAQAIIDNAQDGGVVLLHDIYQTSVEGALLAIDRLTAEGWEFVSLVELYKYLGITPENGKVYRGSTLVM